jgi:transposase InsO family protein
MCFANIPRKGAELRFAVIGPLLTSPPGPRELAGTIAELAEQHWLHPVTGNPVHFGRSTIERWYYIAHEAQDPIAALTRKVRKDRGVFTALTPEQGAILHAQYREHPGWSLRLHTDNLGEHIRLAPAIGVAPSLATVRRFMIAHALVRRPRRGPGQTPASLRAEQRLFTREVRSYEHTHVGALWHLDFHGCSRQVLTAAGDLVIPQLLAIIDDHSRLICHAQWYLDENAENVVHGLIQAILKRGLLRALMTDRGTAMMAHEVLQGLERLGISHDPTLGHSPDQNGKIESFWTSVDGRLMAMLEGEPMLTLRTLNEATHAWIECEYHRTVHSETGQTPVERFLAGPSVLRPTPSSEDLHAAFLAEVTRTQRRSDATISLAARRFEIPNR